MLTGFVQDAVWGRKGGIKRSTLQDVVRRTPFSDFLPWLDYDEESGTYLNQDNTIGWLWECQPLTFAGEKVTKILEGLFRAGFPEESVLQFILYADPYIEPILDAYSSTRKVNTPILKDFFEQSVSFARQAAEGIPQLSNIPLRRFRLFVAAKIPDNSREAKTNGWSDLKRQLHESLAGAYLFPEVMPPEDLLEWSRRMLNDRPSESIRTWDPKIPIRKQVISSETPISDNKKEGYFKTGKKFWRCMTPKSYPRSVDVQQTNELFGGIMGQIADADQIKTPFLYSLNVIFQPLRKQLHTKCNIVLHQQAVGSWAPSLARRQKEYLEATDQMERGVNFVRIIPTLWVYSDDEVAAVDSIVRARRIWEAHGYVTQEDKFILSALFPASLPFGLYLDKTTLDTLERDTIAAAHSVSPLFPVAADFPGVGASPRMLFTGRKGQIAGLDFFDPRSTNQNSYVVASSGSGKSFFVNLMTLSYHASGAKVRLVDIGGSYQKLTKLIGARYLDFSPKTRMCLNPFTHLQEPNGDTDAEEGQRALGEQLKAVTAIFATMATANTAGGKLTDTEWTHLRNAVRWAWKQEGPDASSDTVYSYLHDFPNVQGGEDLQLLASTREIADAAKRLAFNTREYTRQGDYGYLFAGKSTFDIANDDFVVLELENLKGQTDLFRTVTLLVINACTQDLYRGDRDRETFFCFDEAWQFMEQTATGGGSEMLAPIIAEGFRRARKYRGAFQVISQSPLDLKKFGEVGEVIKSNAAFRIYLESPDFAQAQQEGIIDFDRFTLDMVKSLKSQRPRYSELFIDSNQGKGVLRLAVNPFMYYVCTSSPEDISAIDKLLKTGMDYTQAVWEMVKRNHPAFYREARGELK